MKKILVKKEWISKHFRDFFIERKKYNFFMGGRGSSKTTVILINLLLETFSTEFRNIYYCRHEWETIRRFTYKDICQILERTGLGEHFIYSKSENGSMVVKNKHTGWTLSPYGLSDLENIKGMPNPTDVFIDEVTACHRDAIGAVLGVLRTPKAKVKRLICAWNPISEKHYMRQDYFEESNPYLLKEVIEFGSEKIHLRNQSYFNLSTYLNNDFLDKDDYLQNLVIKAKGDPSKMECDVYGRWGNEVKDNLFIHSFNKTRHNKPIEFNDREIIYLSFDFNYNPMTCLVIQRDRFLDWIHVVKEYRLEKADVYAICREIKRDFKDLRYCEVYGDSSGWAHKAEAINARPAFNTIIEELGLVPSQVRQPRGKPKNYIQEKRTLANEIMALHPNFIIGNCPFLIDDIESIQVGEDYKMIKDKDASKSHLLDALCDFLYAQVRKDWDNWKHQNLRYDTQRS